MKYLTPLLFLPAVLLLPILSEAKFPSYCSETRFGFAPACAGSQPEYCANSLFAFYPACAGYPASYCEDRRFSSSITCVGSRPAYCSDIWSGSLSACLGSKPAYCNETRAAYQLACIGTNPEYCELPAWSYAPACIKLPFAHQAFYQYSYTDDFEGQKQFQTAIAFLSNQKLEHDAIRYKLSLRAETFFTSYNWSSLYNELTGKHAPDPASEKMLRNLETKGYLPTSQIPLEDWCAASELCD